MKTIVMVVLAMVMMFSGVAQAGEWKTVDTMLEVTYQALAIVDYSQTRYIQSHPIRSVEYGSRTNSDGSATFYAKAKYRYEGNPILGAHPSNGEIATYFIATGVAHAAISYGLSQLDTPNWMPCTWSQAWQSVTIGVESGVVGRNFSMGIKMDF